MAHRAPTIDDDITDAVREDDMESLIAEAIERRDTSDARLP
jgi:hypothetical protein